MKQRIKLLLACSIILAIAIIFTACATFIGGGTGQAIKLYSSPTSAEVQIKRLGEGIPVWKGTTPATVKLQRKYEYVVTISLEGYQRRQITLQHGTNGWLWGNAIFWPGFILDLTNGAAKKLEPDTINIQLSMTMNRQGDNTLYATLRAVDAKGEPYVLPVPLVPEQAH